MRLDTDRLAARYWTTTIHWLHSQKKRTEQMLSPFFCSVALDLVTQPLRVRLSTGFALITHHAIAARAGLLVLASGLAALLTACGGLAR